MSAFCVVLLASISAHASANQVAENVEQILPSSEAREWRAQDYTAYLQQILQCDLHKSGNLRLSFPRVLVSDGFTLSNGRVTRYLIPTIPHGFYDKVMFHARKNELFGVFQLYAPTMEISYEFPGGQLLMMVTHSPIQLHMDVGEVNGGMCRVDRGSHETFYFLDNQLKVDARFSPNGQHTGQQIVGELMRTWVPLLYTVVFDIRMQMFVRREKELLLQNQQRFPLLGSVCSSIS